MKDWNYSGNPSENDRDQVRFLVGDTCEDDPLIGDREIEFAINNQSSLKLAAAMVLRALVAKLSRFAASQKVGDISTSNAAAVIKAYTDRANELDPSNLATAEPLLCLPRFGGLSISEKEVLDLDSDAVQPSFRKGMNDIPGGPDDVSNIDYDRRLRD